MQIRPLSDNDDESRIANTRDAIALQTAVRFSDSMNAFVSQFPAPGGNVKEGGEERDDEEG